MITRIQNFFLKHNKWLFGSLLVVIIVTFVLTIGPQSIFDGSGPVSRQKLEFYGFDLSSPGDQQVIVRRAELSMALNPELRLSREQLMDYAYMRVTGLGMANRMGIPAPSAGQLADYVATIRIFHDPESGEFSPETYNMIIDSLATGGRFSRDLLGLVLREDYRIAQVRRALAGPDFSLPSEVRQDFIDREASYDFVLAHFSESGFDPEFEVTEEEINGFFQENPSRYEVAEKLSMSLLSFTADSYLDLVAEPTETAIVDQFTSQRERYQQDFGSMDDEGQPVAIELDAVRGVIIEELKRQAAGRLAEQRGSEFTLRLWSQRIELRSPEYEALLQEFRAQKRPLEPFARNAPPAGVAPRELLDSMWIYVDSSFRYFSDVARFDSGAVVGILEGVNPAFMPEFSAIREQVERDYRSGVKRRLFAERGREIHALLRQDPAAFVDEAAALGLRIEDLDPFQGTDVPFSLRFGGLWEQIQFLAEREISPMILQSGRGTFAFLREKSVPVFDQDNAGFALFASQRREVFPQAMGWGRLREISESSLNVLLGESPVMP